jgi:hypothetical protein
MFAFVAGGKGGFKAVRKFAVLNTIYEFFI